ncbi:MAG TPA: hypothetical protein VJN00_07890 [Steroidobacteraceae bacterium]|nr:hypothetical protein [Steroidobacteraceae bacterium]
MSNVNWGKFVLGALIVTVICFVSDGFLHQKVVQDQWMAVYEALATRAPEHAGWTMIWFVVFEAGRGFLTMYTYVLLRPRLGPGAKTATWAGVVAWVAFSLTGPAQFIPLGFYSESLWFTVAIYQLVFSIVAAIAGAAPYGEKAATPH